jgi:predicted phosphoribosyltransferase
MAGKVAALRRLAAAYQRLSSAITGLVVEAVAPSAEALRTAAAATAELRAQVAKNEQRVADLERKFATIIDDGLPAGMRFDLGLDPPRGARDPPSRPVAAAPPIQGDPAMTDLGERIAVLRDEVLDVVAGGSEDAPAVAIFDAIVRTCRPGSTPRSASI